MKPNLYLSRRSICQCYSRFNFCPLKNVFQRTKWS